MEEQIVYSQLDGNEKAVWSLLLASGYLKVLSYEREEILDTGQNITYELTLTNFEVKRMLFGMVRDWFTEAAADYNDFIKALLLGDIDTMNAYMNDIAHKTFSFFDEGKNASREEPERFYYGFVLGLIVDKQDKYYITSNGESGFGRYDVMLEPKRPEQMDAIILEFKVRNRKRESSLEDTVQAAKQQIMEKEYAEKLVEKGIPVERI